MWYVGCCYRAKLRTCCLVHRWLHYSGAQGGFTAHVRPTHSARTSLPLGTVGGKAQVTGDATASAFGRSPVSGRSSYTLFQGGLSAALLTIPLRDAVWPLTFMLAHKAVPHGCCHLLFTTRCSTIPTSPALTPVSPHGAAGQQKQTSPSQTRPKMVSRYDVLSQIACLARDRTLPVSV